MVSRCRGSSWELKGPLCPLGNPWAATATASLHPAAWALGPASTHSRLSWTGCGAGRWKQSPLPGALGVYGAK